jgi:tRNA(Ile)-lysidine synthase
VRGARPEREIERAIASGGVIRSGERVLVACSGGPDSVALAAALHSVAQSMDLILALAYVNHGVRASAWQDECVVLEIAARYQLPLEVMAVASNGRDEQSLREARYAALVSAARAQNCNAVATAHHAEDQSETVLLALLRGAGPGGLSGMRARRALETGIDLVRPLIGIPSETLRAYCHARALPYAVDPTNAETALRRNAVREALTALRPLFPGLDAAVARAASLLAAERDDTERAQLRRELRRRLAGEVELLDIDFEHVEAAVQALEEGRTGTFYMKPGVSLRIERDGIQGMKSS